jgi:predicted porin
MRKYVLVTLLLSSALTFSASAQVGIGIGVGPRYGYGYGPAPRRVYPRKKVQTQSLPRFQPEVHLSLGYGYPNLDSYQMAGFYNSYRGQLTQTGPITGAIDIKYSRSASLGVMVTHGQVSAPYYNYGSGLQTAYGSLDNWSVMVNMMNYIPTGIESRVEPYFRAAVGLNIWKQDYTDATGNKLGYISEPNQLAYQVGLGVNLKFSKNTGLFMEAGYGKYILHGGLSFKL